MSDATNATTTTSAAAAAPPATPPPADPPAERTVPYDRFAQVNEQKAAAQQQLEEMQQRLQELEDRDKSELDKERSKREQFEQQATEMSQQLQRMERSAWLRSAAAEAGFDDPEDAVAFINPGSVDSAEAAEKEVKKLAKRKPKLLRETTAAPQIGQVLANGQRVDASSPQADENAKAFAAQIAAAQETDGWQSIPLG